MKAPAEKLMPQSHVSFKCWLYNEDSGLYFSVKINFTVARKKGNFIVFLLFLFQGAKTFILNFFFFNSESALYNQLLKLIWECGISFSSGTVKDGLKCACCQTINFVQGSGEAHAVWKLTYSNHHSFDFKRKYIIKTG